MYEATYQLKIVSNSEETERQNISSLDAKFDFKKEVAPKDRKKVRSRINRIKNYYGEFKSENDNSTNQLY